MSARIESDQSAQNSQLFMLRLWLEDLGSRNTGWRGKVQHVKSGEVRYFRDWSILEDFIEQKMRQEYPEGVHTEGIGNR